MPSYVIRLVLLVLFYYNVDAEGSKGDYTKLATNNVQKLGYGDIVKLGKGDNNDISIKLTAANNAKTTDLAIRLTEEADKVLSFHVEYGVQSPECRNTTTTKFHFGEQNGAWAAGSPYFRVMMLQGTVDPVVPFELGDDLQITVNTSSSVLAVTCDVQHNWVNGSFVKPVTVNGSPGYAPKFYLDEWRETGNECKTPKAQQFVKVILHNAEVWTTTGRTTTPTKGPRKASTPTKGPRTDSTPTKGPRKASTPTKGPRITPKTT